MILDPVKGQSLAAARSEKNSQPAKRETRSA